MVIAQTVFDLFLVSFLFPIFAPWVVALTGQCKTLLICASGSWTAENPREVRAFLPLELQWTRPEQSVLCGWSSRETRTKDISRSRCVHQRAQPAQPRHHGGRRDGERHRFPALLHRRGCAHQHRMLRADAGRRVLAIAWCALAQTRRAGGGRKTTPRHTPQSLSPSLPPSLFSLSLSLSHSLLLRSRHHLHLRLHLISSLIIIIILHLHYSISFILSTFFFYFSFFASSDQNLSYSFNVYAMFMPYEPPVDPKTVQNQRV